MMRDDGGGPSGALKLTARAELEDLSFEEWGPRRRVTGEEAGPGDTLFGTACVGFSDYFYYCFFLRVFQLVKINISRRSSSLSRIVIV